MRNDLFKHLRNTICSLMFIVALVVSGKGQIVSAEEQVTPICEERWDAGTVLEQATMEKDGEIVFTCGCCGNTKTEVIPMISSVNLENAQVVYNQKEQIPSAIVTDSKGNNLVCGTDYSVEYDSALINVGCYKVTVDFTGKYVGSKELDFVIVPKAPVSANAKLNNALQVGGHNDINFSWNKSTGATGYLVYYKKATASTWNGPVDTTKTSYVRNNLLNGTKYTFKVVPYFKSSSGTKYYDSKAYKSVTVSTKMPGGFITKNGKKYYEYYKGGYADGKYAKSKFLTVNSKTYYFNASGVMHTGWLKLSANYYFFNRSTGVQKKNCTIDGIKIKKDGKATNTTLNKNKMDLMITARKKMQSITKVTDTKAQKLKKVFKWVMDKPYKRYRILPLARKTKGWEVTFANDIFKKGQGCCVSEACAFAFLAKECGYTTVYVADDSEHAWVEINGRVYDTLFAVSKNYNTYYNGTYKKAKLWCHNKKKI